MFYGFFRCGLYIAFSVFVVFFFKQKTAYEMRISDWSSDVCSSDLKLLVEIRSRNTEFFGRPLLVALKAVQRLPDQDILDVTHCLPDGGRCRCTNHNLL